ncbi:MAG: hypothetical protein GY861_06540 [bacterium]|nr:hypothetical protein [bacterium]
MVLRDLKSILISVPGASPLLLGVRIELSVLGHFILKFVTFTKEGGFDLKSLDKQIASLDKKSDMEAKKLLPTKAFSVCMERIKTKGAFQSSCPARSILEGEELSNVIHSELRNSIPRFKWTEDRKQKKKPIRRTTKQKAFKLSENSKLDLKKAHVRFQTDCSLQKYLHNTPCAATVSRNRYFNENTSDAGIDSPESLLLESFELRGQSVHLLFPF